uniref:Metalloendopeptidase n=1 Tax=Ascaris lumbricoides TaxID=6252 RepID=A0A0M3IDY4_ASCLU
MVMDEIQFHLFVDEDVIAVLAEFGINEVNHSQWAKNANTSLNFLQSDRILFPLATTFMRFSFQFHTVTHELAHALGIFHTQSRSDRDQYVTIIAGNAEKDQRSNFVAETSKISENYGIPYEYGSVMHYRNHELAYRFSVNQLPTVVPRDPLHEQTMGSGTGPSFLDVLLVNKHYRCKNYNTKCANGGYAHPRRCDICACPSGFGGKFCESKASSQKSIHNLQGI